MVSKIPDSRIVQVNQAPIHVDGRFVIYWMIANRRVHWNFSLERAIEWAQGLQKPLLILEGLRCDYPWASDRFHSFILQGMKDNREHLVGSPACYYPYVEPKKDEGKGLLGALASDAAIVVTDCFPAFFLPGMVRGAARGLSVRVEMVDSNGLLPLGEVDRVFSTAFSFRRFLQKNLPGELDRFPRKDPLAGISLPAMVEPPLKIASRWPPASDEILNTTPEALRRLPLDHRVAAVQARGGAESARERLRTFVRSKLRGYHLDRNHPDRDAASGLSPYLHFGHISVHEIFHALCETEDWSPERLSSQVAGQRAGWWGMGEGAEAFLDQLITWRELGFNMCSNREDHDRFESLPDWAMKELVQHGRDSRPFLYAADEFETARTHDPLWNAAQRELLREGRIHNYLRMLWGKKILEWSSSAREALGIMIELNNKYALDGRDPNSYTGIFWILGRYDRPFGPSRPVFGTVRYMSSKSTARKLELEDYMNQYDASAA
ncbi:MAG TPA: deoxyribodipyrimidine photolyase [Syntrophobacteraceae bacterium]|nr:deoxyribodipyrimidine photolyase [Syntrophobacteraceae bacterium]